MQKLREKLHILATGEEFVVPGMGEELCFVVLLVLEDEAVADLVEVKAALTNAG